MNSAYHVDLAMLKAKIVRTLICLCTSSMLLTKNDVHLDANISHLKQSITSFTDVMTANELINDFKYAVTYMQELKEKEYLSTPVETENFTIQKHFKVELSTELKKVIEGHQSRVSESWQEWRSSDLEMIEGYQRNFNNFKGQLLSFI